MEPLEERKESGEQVETAGQEPRTHSPLAPMVTEAKEALSFLFKRENRGLWYACFPTPSETPAPVPPSAFKNFSSEMLQTASEGTKALFFPMVESVGEAVEALFTGGTRPHLHNTWFWRNFLHELQFELSEGLMVQDRERSEAEVCYQLLAPLLCKVAHSTAKIPIPEGCEIEQVVYSSSLNCEVTTEERGNRRGRRPQVDFTLSAHVKSDVLYCVPVEAKKVVEMKHMAQLSEYQGTLCCGGMLRKYVSVGMLVDEHKVRFVFSPWCYEDSVPGPITLVSPVMKWRHGPAVSRAACTALCLVPTLVVPRFKIDVDMAASAFAEKL